MSVDTVEAIVAVTATLLDRLQKPDGDLKSKNQQHLQ